MNETTTAPLLLSVRDAAIALSISERTLFSLTKSGEIPRLKIGAKVLYSVDDLRQWIDGRREVQPC